MTDHTEATLGFLASGGDMGARIRAFDWATTPLGAPEQWPQSLRTAVSILLESGFPMLIAWGPGFTQFYNDAYRPILGSTKHPVALGASTPATFPEIWDTIGPMFAEVRDGRAVNVVDLMLQLDRHHFVEDCYFTFSYSPIREESGEVGGVLVTVTETTERVIGARRLKTLQSMADRTRVARTASEACVLAASVFDESLLDLPFAVIYLLDPDGRHARQAGIAGDADLLAIPASVDLDERGLPWPITGGVQPTSVGGRPALVIPVFEHAGDVQPAGFLVAGISEHLMLDEAYRGFVSLVGAQIGSAISSARALERARARADALAELDRAKTTFFSNVSHEFRTPLTLMLGPIEESLDRATDPADRARLELAHRNALRLQKLVNTLLDFSRIEAGRMRARFEPTDLAELTTDLASAFRSACEQGGLRLVVNCAPLPHPVRVDRDMWEKIVLNLISNAVKFTFDGSVTVRLCERNGEAVLSIRDTGTGIAGEELPHIFDRFHRIEGARGRTHEGTGIGLALVQELVRLNGGTIGVESAVEAGSTFTVTIPLVRAQGEDDLMPSIPESAAPGRASAYALEAEQWTHAPAVDAPADPVGRQRPRVLLADDNADMREYLTRLLRETYDVEAVADGHAALTAIDRASPDLVVSDVMMPGLDGFGLLQRLRADERTRAIPILMLTARAGEDARIEGIQQGADAYLTKPFSSRELLARIGALLSAAELRERSAAALRDGEARFRHMADHAPMMVWVTEPDGTCSFLSRSWYEFTGQAPDEGLGLGWAGALHPEELEQVKDRFSAANLNRAPYRCEYRLRKADGRFRWVIADAAPRFAGDGTFDGYIGSVIDITDRKDAEDRREQALDAERAARSELERASRAKDEFLATLSHELRTPLHTILSWSDLLAEGTLDPSEVAEALSAISRNARLQSQLIEDLLDMSRVVSGDLRLNPKLVSLADVIGAAVQSIHPVAAAKGVRVVRTFESADGVVTGDSERLQQVFWNLIGNAVKFTPAGGRIDVSVAQVGARLEVSVSDTGEGIDPAFLPYVFDRFRQGDGSTTRAHGGLGIGLSIVSQLIALHKGTVRAASPGRGKGSTLTVSLPMAMRKTERVRGRERRTVAALPQLRGRRILVVDDDADGRAIARRILTGCEADVTVAASGKEALAAIESGPFDLLVSDIGMTEMDGFELIRRIRELTPGTGGAVPAVALTAYARPDDRDRALKAGFQRHVAKPINQSELLTVCASLIDRPT